MFDLADESDSIILAGIVLIVYEAIMLMAFYFLAPIVVMILYSIFQGSTTLVSNINVYQSEYFLVTKILFAVGFIIPFIWFVAWAFRVQRGNYGTVIRR